MQVGASVSSQPISDYFLGDHRRLEIVFQQVLAAVEGDDRACLSPAWSDFELGLLTHMRAEEAYLLPALLESSPRDARAIVTEHQHIRSRLLDLGAAVDLHTLRFETARGFIDELRAHARREDAILYRRGDELLEPAVLDAILLGLGPSVVEVVGRAAE